jgi:hypothetical protein
MLSEGMCKELICRAFFNIRRLYSPAKMERFTILAFEKFTLGLILILRSGLHTTSFCLGQSSARLNSVEFDCPVHQLRLSDMSRILS